MPDSKTGPTCYTAKTSKPVTADDSLLYRLLRCGVPPGGASVFEPLRVRGSDSVSTGILLSCCKLDLLKCTVWNETCAMERGRR